MKITRAHLRDTTDLLQRLGNVHLNPMAEIYLVTADVSSLYTIIQHEDASLSLNWALSRREDIPDVQK